MTRWTGKGYEGVIGPREAGPHRSVFDRLIPERLAEVWCTDCGAEWPEGGRYPLECRKRIEGNEA